MPIQTSDVVEVFEKVADLLEIEGENRFKVRAYRDAVRTVGGHSRSVAEMVEQDKDLTGRPARKDFPRLFCAHTGARGVPAGNGEIRKNKGCRTDRLLPSSVPARRKVVVGYERGDQTMARKAEWETLKERSAKRFGEDSVFGEGPLGSRLAVVGEAPGKQEVEEGRPFVGNAGKVLDKLLEEAGIERSEVYVTNIVKVRPTKEGEGRTQNRPPRAGEIREGIEVLREELGFIKPRALVLLGGTPAKALIKKSFTLNSNHGTLFDSELGWPALATYHPAYLLRLRGVGSEDYDQLRSQVVEDLRTAWQRAHCDG